MSEEWRSIAEYVGYEVSNFGCVRSRHIMGSRTRNLSSDWRILQPYKRAKNGYLSVTLCNEKGHKLIPIHKLVLEAFVGIKPSSGHECRHLDGNAHNNSLTNLAWGTCVENANDRRLHGTLLEGERHGRAKLTSTQVKSIRKDFLAGDSMELISRTYGIRKTTVSRIVRHKLWRNL